MRFTKGAEDRGDRTRYAAAGSVAAHAALALLLLYRRNGEQLNLRIDTRGDELEIRFVGGAAGGVGRAGAGGGGEATSDVLERLEGPTPNRASSSSAPSALPSSGRGARVIERAGERTPLVPEAGASAPPSGSPSAPPEGPSPFLLGRPGARAGRAVQPGPAALSAGEVFARGQAQGVSSLARNGLGSGVDTGAGDGEGPGGGTGAGLAAGYREQLRAAVPRQIPGSHSYFRRALERMRTAWRPRVRNEPSVADAIIGTAFTSPERYAEIQRRQFGATGPESNGGGYAATQELRYVHPHSEVPAPIMTMEARAAATERHTLVEFVVEQDGEGRLRSIRVVRRSGVQGFDRTAEEAVREAVAHTTAPEQGMGRGWRSRWSCEVIADRSPILTALPGVGGLPATFMPTVEAVLDPNPGDGPRFRYPGSLHVRSRVRVLSSEVIP